MEWGTAIAIGLLVIVLLFYFAPALRKKRPAAAVGPFDLGVKQSVLPVTKAADFYAGSEGTLQAFVYLTPMVRTGAHVQCGTEPGQPNCEDGTYGICPCPNGYCYPACKHTGYLNVLTIGSVVTLEVLVAPDASRPGGASTQLVVKTEGPATSVAGTTQKYVETMMLPALPFQKWTMVSIAREGRRFDIYYNDALVLSKTTLYMPSFALESSNGDGVTSGSSGLIGQVANVSLYTNRIDGKSVGSQFRSLADTRGQPFVAGGSAANPLGLSPGTSMGVTDTLGKWVGALNPCPDGECLGAPVIREAQAPYEWTTAYG